MARPLPPYPHGTGTPHAGGKRTIEPYEAEAAFHHLQRAQEIKNDPALHAAAKAHGRRIIHSAKKVVGQPGPNPAPPGLANGYTSGGAF